MRQIPIYIAVVLLFSSPVDTVLAQPCPNGGNFAANRFAGISGNAANLYALLTMNTCTRMATGSPVSLRPIDCRETIQMSFAYLIAEWPSQTRRLSAAGEPDPPGCQIACTGPTSLTCFIKPADGLPVELLNFEVEE